MDWSDLNVLRKGIDLLSLEVGGFQVKELLDLLLAALVAAAASYRGCKYVRGAASLLSRLLGRKPDDPKGPDDQGAPDDQGEPDDYAVVRSASPALWECLRALNCPEATYDAAENKLTCDGLTVLFASGAPDAGVKSLAGVSGPLEALLDADEITEVVEHAKELRLEVMSRDRRRANRDVAEQMRKVRAEAGRQRLIEQAARMTQQGAGDQGDGPRLYEELPHRLAGVPASVMGSMRPLNKDATPPKALPKKVPVIAPPPRRG